MDGGGLPDRRIPSVEQLPFEIGSGEGVDLKLHSAGVAERHCAINQVKATACA